jgi:type 1 glutamine amidotransferase
MDNTHPSTAMLPSQWHVYDEIYNFKSDPRTVNATVLLSADEASYSDPGVRKYDQGTPHPIAWCQEHGAGASGTAGRSFYTSLGHTNETWRDEVFLGHVIGGIRWALAANTTRAFNASAQVGNVDSSSTNATSSPTNASPATTPTSSASRPQLQRLLLVAYVFALTLAAL